MSTEGTQVRVALVSVPDEAAGRVLARTLVEQGLVACGTVIPGATSIYVWKGEVCEAAEAVLLLKLPASGVDALLERLPALHPYEVPELLVLPVTEGHRPYLGWVEQSVGGGLGA